MVYTLDEKSHLPVQVELPAWGYVRRLDDIREVGRFLFPHRYWSPADPSQVTVLEMVALNPELDRSRFRLPWDIR